MLLISSLPFLFSPQSSPFAILKRRNHQIHNWCVWITCLSLRALLAQKKVVVVQLPLQRLPPVKVSLKSTARFNSFSFISFLFWFSLLTIYKSRLFTFNRWRRQCHWTFRLSCQISADSSNLSSGIGKIWTGVQWIHHTCHESIAWTESYKVSSKNLIFKKEVMAIISRRR